MRTRVTAVILAGTLRPSPLRRDVDRHVLSLPVCADQTLLERWSATLAALPLDEIRAVVSNDEDLQVLRHLRATKGAAAPWSVMLEPSPWRGTAGVLRDVTADLDAGALVLVGEATCLPPRTLEPLMQRLD
ncbi:MAG: hypothetical protein ACYTGC_16445, partial [Planctomycetota bacterium]